MVAIAAPRNRSSSISSSGRDRGSGSVFGRSNRGNDNRHSSSSASGSKRCAQSGAYGPYGGSAGSEYMATRHRPFLLVVLVTGYPIA